MLLLVLHCGLPFCKRVIGIRMFVSIVYGYWDGDVCKLVCGLSHPVHMPFASDSLFTLHTTPTWLGSCQSYSANCCYELMPFYKLWPAKVAAIYYCLCYLTCPLLLDLTRGMLLINQSVLYHMRKFLPRSKITCNSHNHYHNLELSHCIFRSSPSNNL